MAKTPIQIQDLGDADSVCFNPFVDITPLISVPNTAIVGRAQIPNIAADLKPSFGIERIMTQYCYLIQNEFGPNGEPVWGVASDDRGLIRLVGAGWANFADSNGVRVQSNTVNDYAEISFYGTGINLFTNVSGGTFDLRAAVDGGAEGSQIGGTFSGIISGRNYNCGSIFNASSSLTLGVHTAKIRINSGSMVFFGYEVLNTNSATSINVNSGISYASGKKLNLLAASSQSYNSGFESGTLGARGGHVVVYQKSDGTINKAVTPAGSQLNLTAADHTNEEVARPYYVREFGAGRSDDFSYTTGAGINLAFTLDDGTTTLVTSTGLISGGSNNTGIAARQNGYISFTFVGTGLDIFTYANDANTRSYTSITIDGGASIGISTMGSISDPAKTTKICSGLPYGTHTVRLTNANSNDSIPIIKFIVYQPKKPSLPTGAIELADYNVMANYIATTGTQTDSSISTSVLRKSSIREFVYAGSWNNGVVLSTTDPTGFLTRSTTNGDSVSYTFFGTGFELGIRSGSAPATSTITIDGILYTGTATALNGTSGSSSAAWTAGTGTYTCDVGYGAKLQVNGLTLGVHTVKVTGVNWAGNVGVSAIDIITPIHSPKSNLSYDQQNSLPIGSCSLSDNRKFSPVKDSSAQRKNIARAIGISSSPSTSSTINVPIPDMSATINVTNGKYIKVTFNATWYNSTVNAAGIFVVYIDGVQVSLDTSLYTLNSSQMSMVSIADLFPISSGVHKVDIYWRMAVSGTVTAYTTQRTLLVEEI